MDAHERFLAALEPWRTSTRGLYYCPAHEKVGKSNPSLSVARGDRAVLLSCKGGPRCSAREIVEALGLTMADLFYDGNRKGRSGRKYPRRSPAPSAIEKIPEGEPMPRDYLKCWPFRVGTDCEYRHRWVDETGKVLAWELKARREKTDQRQGGRPSRMFYRPSPLGPIGGITEGEYLQNGRSGGKFACWHKANREKVCNEAERRRCKPEEVPIRRFPGVKLPLWGLPEVRAGVEAGITIVLVGGPKDADTGRRILDPELYVATTWHGGEGSFRNELAETLRGADVLICLDNDEAGRKGSEKAARMLRGIARSVRIAEPLGEPRGYDVSDFVNDLERAGKSPEEIRQRLTAKLESASPPEVPAEQEPGAAAVPDTAPEPENRQPAEPRSQTTPFRSLADLMSDSETASQPTVVVPRLAWKGRTTLLAAREKMGKSTTMGAAAARVSTGGDFLDGTCLQGPVLWLGLEEHNDDIAARFQRFEAEPGMVFIATGACGMREIEKATRERRPALIVVDTLPAFVEDLVDDAQKSASWTPVMLRFSRLAHSSGAAVVLLHHSRKSDGRYRDSTAIGAGVDVILEVQADGADESVRHLKPRARFPVPKTSFRFTGAGFELTGDAQSLEARILDFVASHPESTKRDVRKGVKGKTAAVCKAIDQLIERGALENRGSGSANKLVVGEQREPPENRLETASAEKRFPVPPLGEEGGNHSEKGWKPDGGSKASTQGGETGTGATTTIRGIDQPGAESDQWGAVE